jgi:hypothetical protein
MLSHPKSVPWLMLFSRITLFFSIQALLALVFFLLGKPSSWEASANWWPLIVTAANLVCIALLIKIFHAEGERYWGLFKIDRKHALVDVLILIGLFVIGGPLGYFPNVLLGGWLFGDPNATLDLFIRPLPQWAVFISLVLFPITQGLAELPTYFGYVMPRFEKGGMHKVLAVSLPALMLGLQHLTMPFLFDMRFILWRALMYIPFAFFCGILLHWRPRWLPYLAFIHVLMNMSFATMFLSVAY